MKVIFVLALFFQVGHSFMQNVRCRTELPLNIDSKLSKRVIRYDINSIAYNTASNLNEGCEEHERSRRLGLMKNKISRIIPKLTTLLLPIFLCVTLPKIANGMGPNLRGPVVEQEIQGMGLAKKMAQRKLARDLAERQKIEAEEGNKIFREQGSKAFNEFTEKCDKERLEEKKINTEEREKLLERLVEDGIDPFRSIRGKAIMYSFDTGIDLYSVPGTEQEAFDKLRKIFPEKYGGLEEQQIVKTKETVEKLRNDGMSVKEIVDYFENQSEKYNRLGTDRGRDLDRLKSIREKSSQKTKKNQILPQAPPVVKEQTPQLEEPIPTLSPKQKANAAKAEAKAAKAEAKAKTLIAKEALKTLKVEAKAAKKAKAREDAEEKKMLKAQAAAAVAGAVSVDIPTTTSSMDTNGMESSSSMEQQGLETGDKETTLEDNDISDTSLGTTATDDDAVSSTTAPSSKLSVVSSYKIPKMVGTATVLGASGYFSVSFIGKRREKKEEERRRQFDLLMGTNVSPEVRNPPTPAQAPVSDPVSPQIVNDSDDDDDDFIMDIQTPEPQFLSKPSKEVSPPVVKNLQQETTTLKTTPQKKKRGISNIFKKNANSRATTLISYFESSPAPQFAETLSQLLTFGAPGRFPDIIVPGEYSKESAKNILMESRTKYGLSNEETAEVFANVVNSMLIYIIDLATSTLTKEKDQLVVDGMNVVLDFMDYGAQLYEDVIGNITISPVTYGGSLSKSRLENLFTTYSLAAMSDIENMNQDRLETLQLVLNISDKRAEGLMQKMMMKNVMSMMKDGGKDGLEMPEGLMSGLAGGAGAGFPNPEDTEISPEELKQSIQMMKGLIESKSITKEEIQIIKDQFKEAYGSDVSELIKAADSETDVDLGDDQKEFLSLFKEVLKE